MALGSSYLGEIYLAGLSVAQNQIRVPGLGTTYLGRPYLGGIPESQPVQGAEILTFICHLEDSLIETIVEAAVVQVPAYVPPTAVGGFSVRSEDLYLYMRSRFEMDESILEDLRLPIDKDILMITQRSEWSVEGRILTSYTHVPRVKLDEDRRTILIPSIGIDNKPGKIFEITDEEIVSILISLGEI